VLPSAALNAQLDTALAFPAVRGLHHAFVYQPNRRRQPSLVPVSKLASQLPHFE
jgi:hypothetical protein